MSSSNPTPPPLPKPPLLSKFSPKIVIAFVAVSFGMMIMMMFCCCGLAGLGRSIQEKNQRVLVEADRLWADGKQSEAVAKYRTLLHYRESFPGQMRTIYGRVIDSDFQVGHTEEGRRLLAEAEKFGIKVTISNPDAISALAAIQSEAEKARREKVVQTGSPKERLEANEEFVSTTRMYSQFKSNEVSADAQYKGKELFVEGTVKSVKKEGFGVVLVFMDKGFTTCQCHLTSEAAGSKQLAQVRDGSWIRVVGKCKSYSEYTGVQMTGCDFLLINE